MEGKVSKIVLIAIAFYYSSGSTADKAQVLTDLVCSYTGGECWTFPNNCFLLEILNAMFSFALVFSQEWCKYINPGHTDQIDKLSMNEKAKAIYILISQDKNEAKLPGIIDNLFGVNNRAFLLKNQLLYALQRKECRWIFDEAKVRERCLITLGYLTKSKTMPVGHKG